MPTDNRCAALVVAEQIVALSFRIFGGGPLQIFRRVRSLIFAPHKSWEEIAAEGDRVRPLLVQYVLTVVLAPLAVLLTIQLLFGGLGPQRRLVHHFMPGPDGSLIPIGSRESVSLGAGLTILLMLIVLAVGTLALYGLIIANAPRFGAMVKRVAAVKLVAYGSIPAVIGIFLLFLPGIGLGLALVGVVLSIRLLCLGAPILLPPLPGEERRFGRAIAARAVMVSLLAPIAVTIITMMVLSQLNPLTS